VLTLIALLVFLFINRTVFGVQMLMIGLVLNLLVIGANGGRMPADPRALIATGQSAQAQLLEENRTAANCVIMSEDTHLNFLGDRIVLPLLGTLGAAYSAGDLVALAGEAALVYGMVRKRDKVEASGPKAAGPVA
jgi:hypothetical protein